MGSKDIFILKNVSQMKLKTPNIAVVLSTRQRKICDENHKRVFFFQQGAS